MHRRPFEGRHLVTLLHQSIFVLKSTLCSILTIIVLQFLHLPPVERCLSSYSQISELFIWSQLVYSYQAGRTYTNLLMTPPFAYTYHASHFSQMSEDVRAELKRQYVSGARVSSSSHPSPHLVSPVVWGSSPPSANQQQQQLLSQSKFLNLISNWINGKI